MDKEGQVAQLGRLYNEASSASDDIGAEIHVDAFNDLLGDLKEHYPNEPFIQKMDEASISRGRSIMNKKTNANQEVKTKCGQLADALGYDLPKSQLESEGDVTAISMVAEQSNKQSVSQEVSIDQVIEMVNYTSLGRTQQEELIDVVREFEEELDGDQDPGTLRKLLNKAEEYSPDVAAKLAMLALQQGITAILNLG